MVSENLAGALVVAYLVPYCAVAGVFLLVGAALDRSPVVFRPLTSGYDAFLVAAVTRLASPADAWPAPRADSTGDTTD